MAVIACLWASFVAALSAEDHFASVQGERPAQKHVAGKVIFFDATMAFTFFTAIRDRVHLQRLLLIS